MGDLTPEGQEISTSESMVSLISRGEIDQQIATAHKYPRSLTTFRKNVMEMVSLSEGIAEECIYSLPRDGKTIIGPSARFAEIVASSWGNSRAGARIVHEGDQFVTAQGVFHDLERNVAITYEVQRRIVDKNNRKFKPDMIGVTANAACSIALRNAILKGVPKAFWSEMFDRAQEVIKGDFETLPNRRAKSFQRLLTFGISTEQAIQILDVKGENDIGLDQLVVLRGIITSLKNGDTTVEQLLSATSGDSSGIQKPQAKPSSNSVAKAEAAAAVVKEEPMAIELVAEASSTVAAKAGEQTDLLASGAEQVVKKGSATGPVATAGVISIIKRKMEEYAIDGEEMRLIHGIADVDKMTKDQGAVMLEYFTKKAQA